MGLRMAPGGLFGGEYICVDLSDFKGISLNMMTRHTKFRFREHFVQRVVLNPGRRGPNYIFPFRQKYERSNVSPDGIDIPTAVAGENIDIPTTAPEGVDLSDLGTARAGPVHRGMYKRDKRGQKYPVDQWGIRVASENDPNRLYRPENVDEAT